MVVVAGPPPKLWAEASLSSFVSALCVVVGYMVMRTLVYKFLPIRTPDDWFVRDCWMSVPRVVCLLILMYLNWRSHPLDVERRAYKKAVLYAAPMLALYAIYLSGSTGPWWPAHVVIGTFVTSAIVGLFEEYAFRGVILGTLLRETSIRSAAIVSAALFAVYHLQAQPVAGWPQPVLVRIGIRESQN